MVSEKNIALLSPVFALVLKHTSVQPLVYATLDESENLNVWPLTILLSL